VIRFLVSVSLVSLAASAAAQLTPGPFGRPLRTLAEINATITPPQTIFAATGDSGVSPGATAVANLTRAKRASFMLLLGDLCYNTQPLAEQVEANYSAEHPDRLFSALGNHEYSDLCGGGGAKNYFAYQVLPGNERYYSFVKGPIRFFVLNANDQEPDGTSKTSKQAMWLKSQLASSTSPWDVVMFHQAPFSSGEHGSTVRMQWPFEQWGADVVLAAHDHDYERILKDDNGDGRKMPYFVAGLGGHEAGVFKAPVADSVKRFNASFGALIATVTNSRMTWRFYTTDGTLIDTYSMTK
jgi:tartrate-resistant acid phosphatase type 5